MAIAQIIGAVVGAVATTMSIRKGNKRLIKAYKEQVKKISKNYNFALNNMDSQQQDAYKATLNELTNLSIIGSKNIAMVNVALAESGLEGRSHNQVSREVAGVLGSQKATTQENYENKVTGLKLDREALRIKTNTTFKDAHTNFRNSLTKGMDAVFKIAQGAAQGASLGTAGASALDNSQAKDTANSMETSVYNNTPSSGQLYSYNNGGYSYNMNYGSAGPKAYNFQSGHWG